MTLNSDELGVFGLDMTKEELDKYMSFLYQKKEDFIYFRFKLNEMFRNAPPCPNEEWSNWFHTVFEFISFFEQVKQREALGF